MTWCPKNREIKRATLCNGRGRYTLSIEELDIPQRDELDTRTLKSLSVILLAVMPHQKR